MNHMVVNSHALTLVNIRSDEPNFTSYKNKNNFKVDLKGKMICRSYYFMVNYTIIVK